MKQKKLRLLLFLGLAVAWLAALFSTPMAAPLQTGIREEFIGTFFDGNPVGMGTGVRDDVDSVQLPAAISFIALSAPTEREAAHTASDADSVPAALEEALNRASGVVSHDIR